MTNTQFNLLHVLALPLALFFFAKWLALPSALERSSSDSGTVSAKYSSYKGGQAVLSTPTGDTLVIWCRQAPPLCEALETRSIPNLRIWVLQSTLLRDTTLVAAEENDRTLVSEAQQNELLKEAKIVQGGLALFFSALAGMFLYFFPFKSARKRANAA